MNMKKRFTLLFSILFIAIFVVSSFGKPAEAATNRTAQLDEIIGTVWVKKAGGNTSVRAYTGMMIQQGDQITTSGDFSSAKLVFSDTKDKIVFENNANLVLTDLRMEEGRAITRVTVLSGSVFSSVTPMQNKKDIFEMNTPGQINSAKGTSFIVVVDPITGKTKTVVLSGIVQVTAPNSGESGENNIYPGQSILTYPDQLTGQLTDQISVLDPKLMEYSLNIRIIEEILKAKGNSDKENDEMIRSFMENLGNGNLPIDIQNQEDLTRYKQNLEKLIQHIARNAMNQGKINEEALTKLLKELGIEFPVKDDGGFNYTATEQEKLKKLQEDAEARKQQKEAELKEQAEKQKANEPLLKNLEKKRQEQQEQQRKFLEEQRKQAEDRLKEQLSNEQKAAFEKVKQQQQLEMERQNQAALDMKKKSEPPPPPPPPPSRPNPVSKIDRDLAAAKARIPKDLEMYEGQSLERLYYAQSLPERTTEEKIEKTRELLEAIESLKLIEEIPLVELKLHHLETVDNGLLVFWEHYEGTLEYKVYLNDNEAEVNDIGQVDGPDSLRGGYIDGVENEETILRIVAYDEAGEQIAERTIHFTPDSNVLTIQQSFLQEDSFTMVWDKVDDETRYEIYLDQEKLEEIGVEENSGLETFEYTVDNVDMTRLSSIAIKAYNGDRLVGSKTILTDFLYYESN